MKIMSEINFAPKTLQKQNVLDEATELFKINKIL
jgi:hypothetical protein